MRPAGLGREPEAIEVEVRFERHPVMAPIVFGDAAARVAPSRGILRRALARMIAAREQQARRQMNAHLLGRDDATLAALGCDRATLEQAARDGYPP